MYKISAGQHYGSFANYGFMLKLNLNEQKLFLYCKHTCTKSFVVIVALMHGQLF